MRRHVYPFIFFLWYCTLPRNNPAFSGFTRNRRGGGLAPIEQAIIVDAFPPNKRASAFALYTVAIVAAPAIGPVLGGWITDNYNWRWVFLINIPIGALSLFLTRHFVHDPLSFEEETRAFRNNGQLRIDWVGIALIVLGSAALELFLDRGQIDDWFGSKFIICMFGICAVCLPIAILWELRQPSPIIDLNLLRVRNFAISNVFYFVFSFGLFASTAMIPEMMQSLYGYGAVNAGLVLWPGAFVIIVLAPVGAQLIQRGIIHPRLLLFGAGIIIGLAFIHYSRFNLATDYAHYALARAYQGIGYGFFLVSLSLISYSHLSPSQNNSASSLTNFFRNWGGSFGIAFVTTMTTRRQAFHQATVGANLVSSSPFVQESIQQMSAYLRSHGFSHADAVRAAYAHYYIRLGIQARFLGFMDSFHLLGLMTLAATPLIFVTKKFTASGKGTATH